MDDLAKELKCRKRICAIYNKTSEDFNTKEEWDSYLEGIEDIIYNLVNSIDVQATEARVSDYERTNRVHIIAKQAKQVEAQRAAQVAAFQAAAASTASATAAKEGDAPAGYVPTAATAGRTFHACLLKLGTPPSKRCPKAYDHLRINMTLPNCNLLSSHDDFSVVSMLPDNVAVLTHLRDPIDRFMSAYEFAIE
ncbi:uncharacterized protein HaLaN_11459, partial [Haematococcus lacustris]